MNLRTFNRDPTAGKKAGLDQSSLLVRLKGLKGTDCFEKAKNNDRESNGDERFHSEKLEELISLEKSVPLSS